MGRQVVTIRIHIIIIIIDINTAPILCVHATTYNHSQIFHVVDMCKFIEHCNQRPDEHRANVTAPRRGKS